MRSYLSHLLVSIPLLAASVSAIACFPSPGAQPFQEEKLVPLETDLAEPHFYFRSSLVMVFVPVDFIANFRHKYSGRPVPLTDQLMEVAPLEEHTDIFKAIILGSERFSRVEAIVAEALESGAALVYSPDMGEFAPEVKVVTYNEVCHGGRRFFYSGGGREHNKIMDVLDWIS